MSAKPTNARKSYTVTKGNRHITVYPWNYPTTGRPKWRFGWQEVEGGPWRYVTRKTKD